MKSIRVILALLGVLVASIVFFAAGCGGTSPPPLEQQTSSDAALPGVDGSDVDGGSSGLFGPRSDAAHGCVNLECQQTSCGSGTTTSVSGVVYDPAGKVPLYNVVVYVPNAPVDPFKAGPTCDQCGIVASGSPIASALTDEKGAFKLTNVPVGTDIPMVIQVGKWRRQVKIPTVTACQDNPLTDHNLTRLPKNQKEGDMPQMALTTGGCDALECLFNKIGIDTSEFTNDVGGGKMHIYTGTGGATIGGSTGAQPFWSDLKNLMKYDIVLLSCECGPEPGTKPQVALTAMHDYAAAGGRVFGTHYHYYWFQSGPADFKSTATWTPDGTSGDSISDYDIDQTFPKGKSFAQWLLNVKASTTLGKIALGGASGDVKAVNPTEAQQWIYTAASDPSAKYMSFNTPIGKAPADQCGRVVYSDLHVTGSGETNFPVDCGTGDLTAQEKALEFLFFDLSSCIQDPGKPPPPPPVK